MRTLLFLTALVVGGCRLGDGIGSDNTGADCTSAKDCDDRDLACVSLREDAPNIGAGNEDGVCLPAPDGWTCQSRFWNDVDELCDCGCGIIDPDCAGNTASSACDENNCPPGQNPVAADNARCQ
jgi:hypothetical protein